MTTRICTRVGLVALLAALAAPSVPLLSQQAAVTVSFRAVTDDGQPITDLTSGDVTIRVGGRARTLESFRLVEAGSAPAPEAPAPSGPAADLGGGTIPPPPPYATNEGVAAAAPAAGQSVLIAVNDMTIRPGTESGIKSALGTFMNALDPSTRIAFVTLPQGTHNVDFTTDRAALTASLEQLAGLAPPQMTSTDFRCQTLESLGVLTGMLQALSGATAPTSVVVISAGFAEAPISGSSAEQCQLRPDDYTVLTRIASAAQAHVYVLQLDGFENMRGDLGLEALAGATNSERSLIGNAGDVILGRIANETSAYYEATFLPEADEVGTEARLGIDVNRPDVTVRAPNSVVFPGMGAAEATEGGGNVSPQDMLRQATSFPDLGLKMDAASSRIAPNAENLRVLALFEPLDRSVTLQAASAGLVSADGRLVAQWTAQPEELMSFPIMVALEAAPGPYRLRVAAQDADGNGGAVDMDIDVNLHPADTIFISDLALIGPRGDGMAPTLEFRDEANAVVYFELYGQPPPDLYATIDLARSVDGDVLTGVQLQAQGSAEADKFLITGTLPIRALDPGDYVVRVTIGRDPEAKLYQTIRKLPPG